MLRPGDLLVVNDTKVIPAQLTAMRGAARIGITLDRRLDDGRWRVLLRNARRVRAGDVLEIDPEFSATVDEVLEGGRRCCALRRMIFMPPWRGPARWRLPPYIARPEGITDAGQGGLPDDVRHA